MYSLCCVGVCDAYVIVMSCAGVISSSLANPTDVLKVRLQSGRGQRKEGLLEAFNTIYRQEGVRGLWRVSCDSFMYNLDLQYLLKDVQCYFSGYQLFL